jgi:putative aldouronate transport system substrate-binding protein
MAVSAAFDESDPDKRSYDENRWTRTWQEELGIQVRNIWISPDSESYIAKWSAAIASQDVPDFANVNDNVYKQLYDADLIADMTDIWQDYVTDEYLESLASTDVSMMTLDGRMYGFPGGTRAMAGTSLLFVRQDWLDKLGLPVPETIDEVVETARKFRDARLAGPDTIPFFFSNNVGGGTTFTGSDGKWDGFFNAYGAYLNYWLEKDGKLTYSSVEPEMRTALLKLQSIYKEGLINRDFATVNATVAREYIASGKAGIHYSSAWSTTGGMDTLAQNSAEFRTAPWKMITGVFPPPAVKGQTVKVQTNSPKGMRIFVSNRTPHPEAVLKLVMLSYHLPNQSPEKYQYYIEGNAEDFYWFWYLPWGDHMTPVDADLYRSEAVRRAIRDNDMSIAIERNWTKNVEDYRDALAAAPNSRPYQLLMNGPYGSFSVVYDYYNKGQVLFQGFNGLPTDTMALRDGILRGALEAAMFEVVMGADISVWDQAVQSWHADGGDQIAREVNAWYDSVKN